MRADKVPLEKTEWLMERLFPVGSICTVGGVEGKGKSTWTAMIAAALSQAGLSTILNNTEDSRSYTRARIEAHGGDLEKCFIMSHEAAPMFPTDTERMRRLVRKHKASAIILDPASQCIEAKLNNDQATRQALLPLSNMAEEEGIAVIFVAHTNRTAKPGSDPVHAIAAPGLTRLSRACFLFGVNPADDSERALVNVKNSYGPKGYGITYTMETETIEDEDGVTVDVMRLDVSDDDASLDPHAILVPPKTESEGRGAPLKAKAADWIIETLAKAYPDPIKSVEMLAMAVAEGFSKSTFERAKKEAMAASYATGAKKDRVWFMHLPDGHPGLDNVTKPATDKKDAKEDADAIIAATDLDAELRKLQAQDGKE